MAGFQPSRLIAVRVAVATLVALAALAWQSAVGVAGEKVISSPGSPLSSIYVDEDLGCQVRASGDAGFSFFGGGTEPGACGTFLAVTKGELGKESIRHVFGTSPPGGVSPEADFKPTGNRQKQEGNEITTPVGAYETQEAGLEFQLAELTEIDSYVPGQDFYTTKITVLNHGAVPLEGTLYHAGNCFLSGLGTGFGALNVPSPGSVACTITPNNSPSARYMAFTPTSATPAASFDEALFSKVWSNVNAAASAFPSAVEGETLQNNGMGLSWPLSLKAFETAGDEATVTFTTAVSPTSPPTSSSSAGTCAANGQFPVSVSAVNGAKAVHYVLDGVAGVVPVTLAGQATIPLTPGQYTLEYWAEDQTGAQEATHHALTVLVGAPTVSITSDQGDLTYEVGEPASVSIVASGPALAVNPSAAHVAISTANPGSYVVTRSATNACGTTEASFAYTVLTAPALGKSVNAQPVSGTVLVALPVTGHASDLAGLEPAAGLQAAVQSTHKGLHFVPLTEPRQLPVGTIFDTVAGVARVATATATKGKLQSGNFGAGIFKLLQARKQKGLTELDLIDAHSARQVCTTLGKKRAVVAKLSSKVLAHLTGSAHGHFTTRGQYSAATVRGTVWGVLNRCDGTLTRVTRGVVTVRDFVRRKTITLFTGQHYLARP